MQNNYKFMMHLFMTKMREYPDTTPTSMVIKDELFPRNKALIIYNIRVIFTALF